ncbi:GntR family transcriptional regulator [Halalkalibacter oceani]|uniref:GntR family transcriptional regulator n=1 Tax=Halalkalibacter oceani TaxID=1653776 RepID=UPI00339433F6
MTRKTNLFIHERMTLQDRVSQTLREAILRGDFQPGERLVQDVLANELGVSRMPIREALRQLESEGLVEFEAHKGALVKKLTIGEIDEIYTLRATLEAMAIRKSMSNLTEVEINEMKELLDVMEKEAANPQVFIEGNKTFHRLIYKGLEWNKLRTIIEQLSHGISNAAPFLFDGQMEKSNKEHRLILDAIEKKDSDLAAELMRKHIERTGKSLKKYMGEEELHLTEKGMDNFN